MTDQWTTLESLILAQAVIKYGEVWGTISRTLKSHPAVKKDSLADPGKPRPLDFTIKSCAARWSELVEEYEMQRKTKRAEPGVHEASPNIRITQNLFFKRVEELKSSIKADELAYNRILRDIEDIQSGKKDHELASMMKQIKKMPILPPERIQEPLHPHVKEETRTEDMQVDAPVPLHPAAEVKHEPVEAEAAVHDLAGDRSESGETHLSQDEHGDKSHKKKPKKMEIKREDSALTEGEGAADEAAEPVEGKPKGRPRKDKGKEIEPKEGEKFAKKHSRARSRSDATEGDGPLDDPESPTLEGPLSPSKKAEKQRRAWLKNVMTIFNLVSGHKHAWAFKDPVKKEDAPNYYEVVLKPTNLTAIKKKLTEGVITTTLDFHREILLLFTNAMIFNPHYHVVHNMAVEMCAFSEELIRDLVEQEVAENPELSTSTSASFLAGLRADSDVEDGASAGVGSPSKRKRDSPTKVNKRRKL